MAQTTTDHDTIRRWVEERGGSPAHVKRTGAKNDPGILRIDFPGFSGQQSLEKLSWDQFFEWFEKNQLAFIYQDRTRGGQQSRFSKLVSRDTVAARSRGGDGHNAGQAHAPRAATGDDALEMLMGQHRQVEELANQLSALSPRDAEFRQKFLALAEALAVHTTIEEQVFYPGVKRDETADLLQHSVEEHLETKRVLATLMQAAPTSDLKAELEELAGLTEEHIIEEEHELFPAVRKALGPDDLASLGRRMKELMARLVSEGEPRQRVRNELEQPARI